MVRCFIALGSNLDDPARQLDRALASLAALDRCRPGRVSRRYANPAVGPGQQPDYLNAVAELFCDLEPLALLAALQRIETGQGRRRDVHWGPRTLDLDLLLYGDQVIDLPQLQVPHPRMYERNWVLYPLADLEPGLIFPDGSRLSTRLDSCSDEGLRPL